MEHIVVAFARADGAVVASNFDADREPGQRLRMSLAGYAVERAGVEIYVVEAVVGLPSCRCIVRRVLEQGGVAAGQNYLLILEREFPRAHAQMHQSGDVGKQCCCRQLVIRHVA